MRDKKRDRTQKKACKAWRANIGEGNDVTSDPYGNHSRSNFGMLDGQNSLFISGKILFLIRKNETAGGGVGGFCVLFSLLQTRKIFSKSISSSKYFCFSSKTLQTLPRQFHFFLLFSLFFFFFFFFFFYYYF